VRVPCGTVVRRIGRRDAFDEQAQGKSVCYDCVSASGNNVQFFDEEGSQVVPSFVSYLDAQL